MFAKASRPILGKKKTAGEDWQKWGREERVGEERKREKGEREERERTEPGREGKQARKDDR